MLLLRRKWHSSKLQPEFRFIRSLRSPHHLVFDENLGRYVISSAAFKPSSGKDGTLSGDLEQILAFDGLEPTAMYPAVRDPVGAASVTIAEIHAVKATVEHDPTWRNWYHGAVRGTKSKGANRQLSKRAKEIIPINQALAAKFDQALKGTTDGSPSTSLSA
ncbi:hypothetical protein [Bradyrhizobium sp. CCBAU 11357]|uniref:hypothetical protein n=1 Tax=Bradyrhizobium sp. CCBAU 11357 TaxID=1630808 RepID=UPI0023039C7A|nr:hypothetical protein [Bradyrhizobium sp. CCBAU 11357]